MRAVHLLIAILLSMAVSVPIEAAPKGRMTYQASLLKRCNDGIAVSCYDYGFQLSQSRKKSDRRKGRAFIRRACKLAYQPACKQKLSNVEAQTLVPQSDAHCDMAKTAAAIQVAGNEITYVEQGSVWYRAGALRGDKVVSINDKPFHGYDQIAAALGTGAMVLNVDRLGKPTSLMVTCK